MLVSAVKCGLSIDEFYGLNWREFNIHLKAKGELDADNWNRTRSLSYMIYLSNTMDKHPKTMQQFWPMPWDEDAEDDGGYISLEEFKNNLNKFK